MLTLVQDKHLNMSIEFHVRTILKKVLLLIQTSTGTLTPEPQNKDPLPIIKPKQIEAAISPIKNHTFFLKKKSNYFGITSVF